MDPEQLTACAVAISSPDLATSREAVRALKGALSPSSLVTAWADAAQRPVMEKLLEETESVGNIDVYSVVADSLNTAMLQEGKGHALLIADAHHCIPRFLLNAISSSDVSLAYRVRPVVLTLMQLTTKLPEESLDAKAFGQMVDDAVNAEHALRLFDCDAVESEENIHVYAFLKANTTRIPEIISQTVIAFDTDPLLLANYLIVSGIICQQEPPSPQLVSRVESILDVHDDDFYVTFVSRYCSIALFHKESNADAYADRWVRAALSSELLLGCSDDSLDAVLDLAGSASTTQSGWRAVVAYLPTEWLSGRLRSRSVPAQLTGLTFLRSVLLSPYFDPSALALVPVLRDAWLLRSSLEEPVRVAVWEVARAVVGSPVLRRQFAASYASFLCGTVFEESATVRELQLRVATILGSCEADLPDATKEALAALHKKGLYPAGSAGVADLPKD